MPPPIPWRVACFDQKDQKKAQKKDTPSKKAKAPPVKKHQSGMSPKIYDIVVARIAKGDTCTMCGKCPLPDKFFTVVAMMKRYGNTLNMTMCVPCLA